MEIIGMAVAGLYAIVATALVSSASADSAGPVPVGGTLTIDCSKNQPASASVSQPNTTVSVACARDSTIEPSAPTNNEVNSSLAAKSPVAEPSAPADTVKDVYLGAECTQPGVLSSVCPGATVKLASQTKELGGPQATVLFPQLPPSPQVVCLKCGTQGKTKECKAVINVAAAPLQGPQACAVLGTSVTLQINKEGGSAQFACGTGLALLPSGDTKAYADDCTKEETLKDLARSGAPGDYVTLKADKLKKKKLCFVCKPTGLDSPKTGVEDGSCKIYVEVGGSTRLPSSVRFGVALACVAAMLPFI